MLARAGNPGEARGYREFLAAARHAEWARRGGRCIHHRTLLCGQSDQIEFYFRGCAYVQSFSHIFHEIQFEFADDPILVGGGGTTATLSAAAITSSTTLPLRVS